MGQVLLTGGAGYIGSHTAVELLAADYDVVIIDNLANSSHEVIERIEKISGKKIKFYEDDVRDARALQKIFNENDIEAAIHFAGLKAVGESVAKPLEYYDNNLNSTIVLLQEMMRANIKKIVFSSSATVYGDPSELPLKETSRIGEGITNPYGWTKFMIERILRDVTVANGDFCATILRYFNPIGAHESGLIGENPRGIPNNLLPFVAQVAVGKRKKLSIFGDGYDTPDGTGVRDYIHVVDLARGHLAALKKMRKGCATYNLGTGVGVSVLEIARAFEEVSGKKIPYEIVARRPGDIAECYALSEKAFVELGWKTEKTLLDACRDSWNFQRNNPDGIK